MRRDVPTKQVVELYRSGKTLDEVADATGLHPATVRYRLQKAHEPRRSRWEHFAKMSIEAAIELYRSGLNCDQVAKRAGVTGSAVRSHVLRAGIKIRSAKGIARYGPDHPNWKGGRFLRNGYVYVHLRGRKAAEHRLAMEHHLGRSLQKHEIVHHLNGIRHDNRIENLTLTILKEHEHDTYVKALQARIRALENMLISRNHTPTRKTRGEHFPELFRD